MQFHVVAKPPHCPQTIATHMEFVWMSVIVIAHTCVETSTCYIIMVYWQAEHSRGGVGWGVGLLRF